jgi:pyridoxal phosphate enzyme (YggS family)
MTEHIAENIRAVQENIAAACRRSGRSVDDVTLVAISKQKPLEDIIAAVDAGVTHIGENRLEEGQAKVQALAERLPGNSVTWHMVGHVQSRKAQGVIEHFDVIHSLDSLKLARRYKRFATDVGKTPRLLLEVNMSGEDAKYGLSGYGWHESRTTRATLWEFVSTLQTISQLEIIGLMTMAPFTDDETIIRSTFRELRLLRDALAEDFSDLSWKHLSMGMTNDYPIAIEEGATIIRIGRAIFGRRE